MRSVREDKDRSIKEGLAKLGVSMVNSKELKDMGLIFKRNPVKLYIPSAEDIPSSFRELLRSLRFLHVMFVS